MYDRVRDEGAWRTNEQYVILFLYSLAVYYVIKTKVGRESWHEKKKKFATFG